MRRQASLLTLAIALVIALADPALNRQPSNSKIDRAVVVIGAPVKLLGVVLPGRYLFLHHEGMMSRGRPCTYVYSLDPATEGSFVVSFHCRPIARERIADFKLVLRNNAFDLPEVTEVQFAGTTEGHRIPDQDLAVRPAAAIR